jgi:hypothetical protein
MQGLRGRSLLSVALLQAFAPAALAQENVVSSSTAALAAAPVIAPTPAAAAVAAPATPSLERFDDPAIRTAVSEAAAEQVPPAPGSSATVFSARAQRRVDTAFQAAQVGDCLHADALKHTPPVVRIGPITIPLAGLLAIPLWGYAAPPGQWK